MKFIKLLVVFQITFSFFSNTFGQSPLKGFNVEDFNGKLISIDDVLKQSRDKIVVVYTWFPSNCGPCIQVMDYYLNEYFDKQKDLLNIKFIALNILKKDIPMAKNVIRGELGNYQLKRADHYFNTEDGFVSQSAPELFIIKNGETIYYENGFYTSMGDTKNNAKHIKEVIALAEENIKYFDQFGRVCNNKKNIKDKQNVQPTSIKNFIKIGNNYKYTHKTIEGRLIADGECKDLFGKALIGLQNKYYDDGKTIEESYINNESGQLDGVKTWFHSNGKVFKKFKYTDGNVYEILESLDSDGNPLYSGNYFNGNGKLIYHNNDGNINTAIEYKDYKQNGVTYSYKDGALSDSTLYETGGIIPFSDQVYKVAQEIPKLQVCIDVKNKDESIRCLKTNINLFLHEISVQTGDYIYIQDSVMVSNFILQPSSINDECTIVVEFIVEINGTISDVKLLRDVDSCGDIAMKILNKMNITNLRWIPAMINNKKIRYKFLLPIKFFKNIK